MLHIPKGWSKHLSKELDAPYFTKIVDFLEHERSNGKIMYPLEHNIFNALNLTALSEVKVVILGQDPYHGEGQAHGLSFSVQDGVKLPPSLRNIYKEIETDMPQPLINSGSQLPQPLPCKEGGMLVRQSGDLSYLAEQGVLLLNSCLTVEKGQAASHSKIGWQLFTDQIIRTISVEKKNIVFLLWGAFAQTKKTLINKDKHLILETTHPSPFSAYRGFLGCKHFSRTNEYLESQGKKGINWILE